MNPSQRLPAKIAALAVLVAGCAFPARSTSEPPGPSTLAAQTVEAVLTQVASRVPVGSVTMTPPLPAPSGATPGLLTPTPTPIQGCSNRATFVDDVTIRDDTRIAPGESFVKIWRLQNTGTCAWTQSYSLAFFGGERMGAPATIPLAAEVTPGTMFDLAVDMTAPTAPGTYQGFWRLRDAEGVLFGIGPAGDQSVWVRIMVVPAVTATITPTPTLTPTPTPTSTPPPAVLVSGTLDLALAASADLDSGTPNPASGSDLLFEDRGADGHFFAPQGGARFARYVGLPSPPGPVDCLGAALSPDPIAASDLAAGSLVCYQTGQGRPGVLELTAIDDSLSFAFTTWGP
jgi:hypothetical protein